MKLSSWILTTRLQTLPLSLSGVLMGAFLSIKTHCFSWNIFIFSLFTTILYQILSNFCNDLGDGVKGTDYQRIGPKRALQSKLLTKKELKIGILVTVILCLISTLFLLYVSFFPKHLGYFLIFIGLGIISILSSIFYTLGKNAYGYFGMGDFFVFIFFGWVGVTGSYFLYSKVWDLWIGLPASAIGFFSVAVLNLNNMRDIENDKKSGKYTLAVRMGLRYAKIYEVMLLNLPFFLVLIFVLNTCIPHRYENFLFMILFFVFIPIRRQILCINNPKDFDPYLKRVALLTFVFVLLFGIGILINE